MAVGETLPIWIAYGCLGLSAAMLRPLALPVAPGGGSWWLGLPWRLGLSAASERPHTEGTSDCLPVRGSTDVEPKELITFQSVCAERSRAP